MASIINGHSLNKFFTDDSSSSGEEVETDSEDTNGGQSNARRKKCRKTVNSENYPLIQDNKCSCRKNCSTLIDENDLFENHKNYWAFKSSNDKILLPHMLNVN